MQLSLADHLLISAYPSMCTGLAQLYLAGQVVVVDAQEQRDCFCGEFQRASRYKQGLKHIFLQNIGDRALHMLDAFLIYTTYLANINTRRFLA